MKRSPRAFSLVEVIIALGVVSTALVGLLGLMGMAFGQLRQSIEMTTKTQIVQGIAAEVEMLDYSKLDTYRTSKFPRFYDDEGQAQTSGSPTALYKVELAVGPAKVPGQSSTATAAGALPSAQQLVVTFKSNLNAQDTGTKQCIWAINNGR